MSPHPLATWVQMSVSTRREVTRRQRRRTLRVVLARRGERAAAQAVTPGTPAVAPTARIPEQRRPVVPPVRR